ncbi:MAG TPA: EAL domain-containing protein [Polyangiaceae bacterium]|nr:EAL domain-containing protein [Polyangiaceae bacterium]
MVDSPCVLLVSSDVDRHRSLADTVAAAGFGTVCVALRELCEDELRFATPSVCLLACSSEAELEVVARYRGATGVKSTPWLVVTPSAEPRLREGALRRGADDVLDDSASPFELGAKLRLLTELSTLRTQASPHESDSAEILNRIRAVASRLPLLMYEVDVVGPSQMRGIWMLGGLARSADIDARAFAEGSNWEERIHPDDRAHVKGSLGASLEGHTELHYEFRLRRRDGGYDWVSNVSLFEPERRRRSGILLDITKQKQAEERLAHHQKMEALSVLAGGIAHDFNNILAVILSFVGFASEGLAPTDRRCADLNEVVKAAHRAARLTRQLLTVTSQQPAEIEPIDLNHRLGELATLMGAAAGPSVRIIVVNSLGPAIVELDPAQLDEVVLNLVMNARDAMPEGGRLTIEIAGPYTDALGRDMVRLEITDTGIGMDARTLQRVFEPFFTTKVKGGGAGLGLATCFGIVDAAGGRISAHSEPGKGSTFTVELPSSRRAPASPLASNGHEPRGHGETVLLVEDEEVLLRALVRVFEGAGYRVRSAVDGSTAKKIIDELGASLDALVTDVIIPQVGGNEVAHHAKSVAPNATIFLTSGHVDGARVDGDFPILWKPIPPREIARAVTAALELRGGARRVADSSAKTVLVIEDDPAAGQALTRLLAGAGFEPRLLTTVAESRRYLETQRPPTLVLCDLGLPDGSGSAVLESFAQKWPQLRSRLFALSGAFGNAEDRRALAERGVRVLSKLTPPAQLLELLGASGAASEAPTPSSRAPSALDIAASPAGARHTRERVLVLERDVAMAQASARMLQSAGFDVTIAASRSDATKRYATARFDALVLDASLAAPELDSLPALPAVILGAAPGTAGVAVARRSATEQLRKPFSPAELQAAARNVIDAERSARVRRQLAATHLGGDQYQADLTLTGRAFESALARVYVAFQPIVRAENDSIYGFEALLRCHDEAFSTPARLLAAAQVLGRQRELGLSVRRAIADALSAHPERDETIFVNIDAHELDDGTLYDPQEPLLSRAARIVLEVSERASLGVADTRLERKLSRLRERGYRFALDDLGEGHVGLSSLVALKPDIVKIDPALVRRIETSSLKRDLVGSIVQAARRSGILVAAEGIESREERDTMIALGCDLLQGYFFARPAPSFPALERPI